MRPCMVTTANWSPHWRVNSPSSRACSMALPAISSLSPVPLARFFRATSSRWRCSASVSLPGRSAAIRARRPSAMAKAARSSSFMAVSHVSQCPIAWSRVLLGLGRRCPVVPLLALADLRLGRWDTWDTGVEAAGESPQAARIGQALEVAARILAELLLDLAGPDMGRVGGDVGDDLGRAVADPTAQPSLAGAGRGLLQVGAVEVPLAPVDELERVLALSDVAAGDLEQPTGL